MIAGRREYLDLLAAAMHRYAALSPRTLSALENCCVIKNIPPKQNLISIGRVPDSFFFVCEGIFRMYTLDDDGKEYNKIFFPEGSFGGSMVALLRNRESDFGIEALEESIVVEINHAGYRDLLQREDELKWYHIQYIEKNWIIEKEQREVAFALEDATARYLDFLKRNAAIASRVPLHHIASNLGITPTQLSRIRKNLEENPE